MIRSSCSMAKKISADLTIDFKMAASMVASDVSGQFLQIENYQCEQLSSIIFDDPVSYVYNPLEYAKSTHEDYIRKFCTTQKHVLFLGMNPGPFGMAQNGVPFGECKTVREWLGIEGVVRKPAREHPNRPIQGLECTRSEVSGRRFWGLIQEVSIIPSVFFRQNFVHNYCPLAFLSKSGKNVTPPELKSDCRNALIRVCDDALCKIVNLLQVNTVIGVGKFPADRATKALGEGGFHSVRVDYIMHPSPVNPAANKGWDLAVREKLKTLGLLSEMIHENNV